MASVVTEASPVSVQAVFTSAKYSDLTVFCGSDKYLLHQMIVRPRSKFFDAACDGHAKVIGQFLFVGQITGANIRTLCQTISTPSITLDSDDPQTVNRMLIYLYTNDYPEDEIPSSQQPERAIPTCQRAPPSDEASKLLQLRGHTLSTLVTPTESISLASHMMNNVLVYAIADKYDLSVLRSLAEERVQVLANDTFAFIKSPDFPKIAKTIFDSTPATDKRLRDIIIDLCSSHIEEIMEDRDTAMRDTIQDIGALSFGILLRRREAENRASKRTSGSKAVVHEDLAHRKVENRSNVERMLDLKEELQQASAAIRATKNQLSDALSRNNQLEAEKDVAYSQRKAAQNAQNLAIRQKDYAINQRNQVIAERDAALNQSCNCLSRLDLFLAQSYKWKKCRNCDLDFDSLLERIGPDNSSFNMQLRCAECRCRHDLGTGLHTR